MKYALIGVGIFLAVAAMGFFCALAGGVSWGTPAAAAYAVVTCVFASVLGVLLPPLILLLEE